MYFLISLLDPNLKKSGYVCVPYTHDEASLKLKNDWASSRNIKSIYFVTATFSEDSKSYFPSSTSHYLMAEFKDSKKIIKDVVKVTTENTSFIFSIYGKILAKDSDKGQSFLSMCYIESDTKQNISEITDLMLKREKIQYSGLVHLNTFCNISPKFTFPYSDKIIILDVNDERSPQSTSKYCEKIRLDICRKGIVMNNFASFSVLEKLK